MEFLDLKGASGAAYRFRRTDLDALPATAGNLVVVTGTPPKLKVRVCAAARSLSRAAPAVRSQLGGQRGAKVFIRLNVARTARESEHADLVAAIHPDADWPDLE